MDMTYDRKRLDDAIKKIAGSGLKPSEIINARDRDREGPTELRYNAHVAFSTMREALDNLEKVHNRRKALVWVSEGYDFNPFQDSRLGLRDPISPFLQNQSNVMHNNVDNGDGTTTKANDPMVDQQKQSETFSDADLAFELGEITRAANRANTTIYTHRPARAGCRHPTSTSRSTRKSGTPTCGSRRTACACWPKRPAASRSST